MHKSNQQPAIMWSTWCGGCVHGVTDSHSGTRGKTLCFTLTNHKRRTQESCDIVSANIGRRQFSMRGVKVAEWWQLLACDLMSFSACRFLTLRSSFHEATDILKAATCRQQGGERCLRKAPSDRLYTTGESDPAGCIMGNVGTRIWQRRRLHERKDDLCLCCIWSF